jgi:alkaline phosphatase D
MAQSRVDAVRGFNPHVRYARTDQRGYMRFALDAKTMAAQLRVVDNALDPSSGIKTAAQFVVDASRPGAADA